MSIEKEINETLLIKAVDLGNRDVQVYDLCEEGKTFTNTLNYPNDIIKITSQSVFRMVYNQAFEQISLMVNSSLNTKRQDIENIIAFAGRRGTGKTSAMYSLEKFLCNNEINFVNAENGSKVFKFIKLYDMKAADLKEDILEHIIEVIRYELDKYINNTNCLRFGLDFDKAKILRETACLMEKEYCSFKNNNSSSDFSYNSIMRTSNKLDMKHRFKTLIKDYSGLLSEDKNVFFIICIDDLDMASDNSKKLVQDIYKYLMIPNLIVFVTTDFSLLNSEIQKEFYENLCPSEDKGHIENLSMKQTHALLRKIIPSDNRITMPSWKKKDYIEMFPVKICFNKGEKDYFTKYFPRLKDGEFEKFIQKCQSQNNDYCISPKDFILMLIANRTKIYLDAKGYKYHFMEPDSLRNLYDMFYLLYNMNNLIPEYEDYDALKKEYYNAKKNYENQLERANKKYIKEIKAAKKDTLSVKRTEVSKPAIIDIYENKIASYYCHRSENRKRLLDYIHFTMREDMSFSSEESDFIDKLLAQPVERRGKMIWDRYFSILRTEQVKAKIVGTYGDDFYKEELAKSKIENYSFGELFRIIYTSTRLGVFEKKFVKFIIAIFSFSLPAFVERAKKEEKDEKHIPYKKLVDNFGYSFLGTWWDDLFISNDNGIELRWAIFIDTKTLNKTLLKDNTYIENAITSLFYLLMLTSKKDNIICNYESTSSNITIYSKPDPTAFIMNIMNIDARLEEPMFVFKNNESNYGESISMRELISKILEIATFKCDYEKILNQKVNELRANYRECHLSNMFKHMDLVYNVIKRVVSQLIYKDPNNISKNENTWFYSDVAVLYNNIYNGINEKLKGNDKVYFAQNKKADGSDIYFSDRFENSLIVKFFKYTKNFNYTVGAKELGIRLGVSPTYISRRNKTFEEYIQSIENNFKDDMGQDLVLSIRLKLYNHFNEIINRTQEYKLNDCLYQYVNNKYDDNKKSGKDILNETIKDIKNIIKPDYDKNDIKE